MALQDVCGFLDTLDDTGPCTYPPNEMGYMWRTLSHGTTTLGFIFQDGVIAAADTRASCKGLICCPTSQKIMPIHSHLVVNTSGSGADCMLWERILTREMRLYQLRHRKRLNAYALNPAVSDQNTKNVLSFGGRSGPRVCYVCSDGLQLKGEIISVGSGSPYAYAVLDDGWRWGMTVDEAVALAREAVFRATHWDAYSGNNVDLFHITAHGWRRRDREDLKEDVCRKSLVIKKKRDFKLILV
uniref:Proteasome subunit beta n=1 Tax=Sinocyclocheilus rhinocerous TaxID=307959 RepID=A0A673IBH7_9TELE